MKRRGVKGGDPSPPSVDAPAPVRGRRLRTIENIRAGLASVWRKVETGQIDLAQARVLVYAGSTLINAIRTAHELKAGTMDGAPVQVVIQRASNRECDHCAERNARDEGNGS
jgi:hypothetical protein